MRGSFPRLIWNEGVNDLIIDKRIDSQTINSKQITIVLKSLQIVGNWSDKWLGPLKRPHKTVIKVNGAQIKTDLSEPLLENNDNYRMESKAVKALLDFESKTTELRGTNTS
jgi:hypothetical protein